MKKLILCFMLALFAANVSAQFSDYVTLRDTGVYMFNRMPDSLSAGEAFSHATTLFMGTLVQQFSSNQPVILYGIALTLCDRRGKDTIFQNPVYNAVLMQRTPGIQDSVIHVTSPSHPSHDVTYRQLQFLDKMALDTNVSSINFTTFQYEFDYPQVSYGRVPCYEFYFDTPRTITGPFYVGRSFAGGMDGNWPREYDGWLRSIKDTLRYFWYSPLGNPIYNDYVGMNAWGFAFPIIGFHCQPLDEESHSLFLTDVNDNGATVHWYSVEDGATYNVRLTSADGSIDSIAVTTDSSYCFYGLPTNHRYNLQVRKQCYYATSAYDTTVYSSWTTTNTSFTLGIDTTGTGGGIDTTGTGGGGIDTTGTGGGGVDTTHTSIVRCDAADFSVSPNPVHGMLTVSLMQPLPEDGVLSLYDLAGRELRRTTVPVGSSTVDFDTEGCPAGTYLLKLITVRGTSTQRIIVN